MTVVVEIANDGNRYTHVGESTRNLGDSPRGIVIVDRDAHESASGASEVSYLKRRTRRIGRVRVRHRLHDNRVGGPYGDTTDEDGRGLSSRYYGQLCLRELNLKANSLA